MSSPKLPLPPIPDTSTASKIRGTRGPWLFRDQTLRTLEFLLDEAIRVPGTRFRFGLDGIVGLVPGLGDVVGGLLSIVIPLAAWFRGVPYVTLVRMGVNVGIGVLVASVPMIGDVFDVFWKANRRNYRLLRRHIQEPAKHGWRDWIFLAVLVAALAFVFAIPILLFIWLVRWLLQR